jgi:hypothetical protein
MKPKTDRMGSWSYDERFKTELGGRERLCVELTCPHEECGRSFIVALNDHKQCQDGGVLTRPCPYCFRASYVPTAAARRFIERFGDKDDLKGRFE